METFKETLRKIWYILYPFLFYYAVMLIIMTIAQWAFGGVSGGHDGRPSPVRTGTP